jgi:hypothetical protein
MVTAGKEALRLENEAELLLGAWQKTVDVQQHFNQIGMEIRKTAVTIVGAVVGAAGFVAEKGMLVDLFGTRFPLAACILVAGIVAWLGFGLMDYYWYHLLLRGSVDSGLELEEALQQRGIPVQLTKCIGKRSPIKILKWQLHSNGKMRLFYITGVAILGVFTWGASSVVTPAAAANGAASASAASGKAPAAAAVPTPPTSPTPAATPQSAPAASPAAGTKKD